MPPFGGILKTTDQLWKIIAFIRSENPSSATKPPLQEDFASAGMPAFINFGKPSSFSSAAFRFGGA